MAGRPVHVGHGARTTDRGRAGRVDRPDVRRSIRPTSRPAAGGRLHGPGRHRRDPAGAVHRGRPAHGRPVRPFPGDGPIERDPQNDILSLVNISDPVGRIDRLRRLVRRARSGELVRGHRAVADRGHGRGGVRGASPPPRAQATGSTPGRRRSTCRTCARQLHVRRDDRRPVGRRGTGPFTDTRTIIVESAVEGEKDGYHDCPETFHHAAGDRARSRWLLAGCGDDPEPVADDTGSDETSEGTPSDEPTDPSSPPETSAPPAETATVPVYFVGDTPQGAAAVPGVPRGRGRQPAGGGRRADDGRRRGGPRLPHGVPRRDLREHRVRRRNVRRHRRRRRLDQPSSRA